MTIISKKKAGTTPFVPFFRVNISQSEITEVVETLKSGWLTTGPKTHQFEKEFASAVEASHAVAVNSCTAALHLAVEALELRRGQGVLVPTMTFASTAEVVRYQGAVPILVDCDPIDLNMNLKDAEIKLEAARKGCIPGAQGIELEVVGMMPVHVGGLMSPLNAIQDFARIQRLWVVEDAAHAFPAAWRPDEDGPWKKCGQGTADVTCFSFYANKTITTGEGGMAVTPSPTLAERMRLMSLHGLSKDAWERYRTGGNWDYRIVAPGYKYNITDLASSIGIHQLRRAEEMRLARVRAALYYAESLATCNEIDIPSANPLCKHSWHLFSIRLLLDRLSIDRNSFIDKLKTSGIGTSVHWRPLHLHPYYREMGWRREDCPVASEEWKRLISLPLFPGITEEERSRVASAVKHLCHQYSRS